MKINNSKETQDIFDNLEDTFKLTTPEGFKEFKETADEASSGDYSKSASSGDYSKSASSGYYSKSASSGDSSKSASSGDYSQSASSGDSSQSASSGDYSKSASSGDSSACSALGYRSSVKGDLGNLLMCSEYKEGSGGNLKPVGGKADIIDGVLLKPNCWYIVEDDSWVEVDHTDGLFNYVISTHANFKKLRNERQEVSFLAFDEETSKSAHGSTLREAVEDLRFKIMSENFDKEDVLNEIQKNQKVQVHHYRLLTGACREGCRQFLVENGYNEDTTELPLSDVIRLIPNNYGADTALALLKPLLKS